LNIALFEDAQVAELCPVTTGRAMFSVTCAGWRLIDLAAHFSSNISVQVRDYLAPIIAADYPELSVNPESYTTNLWLNARLAPTVRNLKTLQSWLSEIGGENKRTGLCHSGHLMACFDPDPAKESTAEAIDRLREFPSRGYQITEPPLDVVQSLHDLIRINEDAFVDNLQYRISRGDYYEIADGVFSAQKVAWPEHVVADTHRGPVVLEKGCKVGPFTMLRGPVYIDNHSQINEHAAIKDFVCVGPHCKIGGEIEATIIEGFSNKQHHGFLGHSYVGSWVNLGAGTCNSDLKNTYGLVNMEKGESKINTGMQFVGCFVGDYAKTAINTSIFTGKTIGACSMVYGVASKNVAAFTNSAQIWNRVTEVSPEIMIRTQERMFGRRDKIQRNVDRQLLVDMYKLTERDRDGLSCEPLVF